MPTLRMETLLKNTNLASALVGVAVFILTVISNDSRIVGNNWVLWRPASGIAVGIASWHSPRDAWRVALAAGAGSFAGAALTGRPLWACLATVVVSTLEAWVGSRVLRGRNGRIPSIAGWGGLRRLLFATFAVGIVATVGTAVAISIALGASQVIPVILQTTPVRMVAVLVVAPLFFRAPASAPRISAGESLAQWGLTVVTVTVVFGFGAGLPIAFVLVPLVVWGASRLPYRVFLAQLFLVTAAVAQLTAGSLGPFGPIADQTIGALLSGLFALTLAGMAFVLIASSALARRRRLAMDHAEKFQRATIDASPIGFAALTVANRGLTLSEINPSGRAMLSLEPGDTLEIDGVFTELDAQILRKAFENLEADSSTSWTRELAATRSGRVLEASMVPWAGSTDRRASFQFIDVTDREATLEREAIDRRRAVDIQSVLIPRARLDFPGYQIAGRSVSSRELGGDFYDWYAIPGGFAVTLGDVMGKGTGAGMVAAALRTSLRLESGTRHPAAAVARVARVIETELSAVSSFATVFTAHIRTDDGRIRYADAGHGLAVVAHNDGTLSQLDSRGLPVGALEESKWTNRSARLNPGDTLVVFSDGVLDLFDGSLVAFDEILRMAREASSTDDLIDRVFALLDPETMDDDVTVVAIRRLLGPASRSTTATPGATPPRAAPRGSRPRQG